MKSLFYKNGLLDSNLFNRPNRAFKFKSIDKAYNTSTNWFDQQNQTKRKNGLKKMQSENINFSIGLNMPKQSISQQKNICHSQFDYKLINKIESIT